MRVLAVTNPAEGHFFPMVPLLWALRAAGHDVLVCAPESFQADITGSGLAAMAIAPPMDMIKAMRPDSAREAPRQPNSPSAARIGTGQGFGRLASLTHLGIVDTAEAWRPDVVIGETSAYAAGLGAARVKCPYVEFRWGVPLHPEVQMAGLRLLNEQGMEPPAPDQVVSVCPPAFLKETPPPSDWSMRYVPYNGPSQTDRRFLTAPDRRRVLITLGTVLPRYGDVNALLVELTTALDEQGVDVVVALRESDKSKLTAARLPEPLARACWIPLTAVLPTCSAVVHHGGSGTTLTSLSFGLPQVAIPHFADQFVNAERLADSGCGLVAASDVSGQAIAKLVDEVLNSASYTDRAAAIRLDSRAQPTPAEIARRLAQNFEKGPSRGQQESHDR